MFRVLDSRTGELAVSLDYCANQFDTAFREPAKAGKMLCPHCRAVVVLSRDSENTPHFVHAPGSDCPNANQSVQLLEVRAALYGLLRREFGPGVTVEHDLKDLPRAVDCWVESAGKKFAYWIFDADGLSERKLRALRSALESAGDKVHFVFVRSMLNAIGEGTVRLGETEKFAKVCTPYDVLEGQNEGGSLHYIGMDRHNPVLVTYRTRLTKGNSDAFSGVKKENRLAEVEICPEGGFLVHPLERTHNQIVRARKAREKFEEESEPEHPEAIQRRQWELETRRSRKSNATVSEIVARILRKRIDPPSRAMLQEREGPCEFCGVVTGDWIVFDGKTGKCQCRKCYEQKGYTRPKIEAMPDRNADDGKVA